MDREQDLVRDKYNVCHTLFCQYMMTVIVFYKYILFIVTFQ